jgi:hypothetical protein
MPQIISCPRVVVADLPCRPCIYELPELDGSPGLSGMYMIHVPAEMLHRVEVNKLHQKDGFVVARSRKKPWVLVSKPGKLARDLTHLDAQNIPRDEYFMDKTLMLHLSIAELTGVPRGFTKSSHVLILRKVEVVS